MKGKEISVRLKFMCVFAVFYLTLIISVMIPFMGAEVARVNPEKVYFFWPTLIFIWVTSIPFYIASFQGWFICQEIGDDNFFSKKK
ncbi:DUF2975 domain-containing protein [Proteinivorax tanatarense]|uniref:DUF2975 domain-containing protein n=1 Tax=Proteinivorax tanatarense TaxID=1260629 RepID=A0AAU7VNU8_9FIRM